MRATPTSFFVYILIELPILRNRLICISDKLTLSKFTEQQHKLFALQFIVWFVQNKLNAKDRESNSRDLTETNKRTFSKLQNRRITDYVNALLGSP